LEKAAAPRRRPRGEPGEGEGGKRAVGAATRGRGLLGEAGRHFLKGVTSMLPLLVVLAQSSLVQSADAVSPRLSPEHEAEWWFPRGEWALTEGVLEQRSVFDGSVALLREPALADFALTVDFNIQPEGEGVRAAAVVFRATGTLTYYWVHLDSKNSQVLLVRSTPDETWDEITRGPCKITAAAWHTAKVEFRGKDLTVSLDGNEVLSAADDDRDNRDPHVAQVSDLRSIRPPARLASQRLTPRGARPSPHLAPAPAPSPPRASGSSARSPATPAGLPGSRRHGRCAGACHRRRSAWPPDRGGRTGCRVPAPSGTGSPGSTPAHLRPRPAC